MNVGLTDRIVSILAYWTFGIFSILWLVYVNITKKRMSPYLVFNIYQAIFISVALAALSLLYQIALGFLSVLPFVGGLVIKFHNFFMATPVYFSFTLSGLLVMMLLLYLSIISLMGKRPYIPVVSEAISGFGG